MSTIEIKNLTFGYDGQDNVLFDHANLTLASAWKLGLTGRNGRGKTTLLNLLQGKLPFQGTIQTRENFYYFPQTIQDTTQLTFYALSEVATFEQWELEREFNLLHLKPEVLWQPFASLSGGEQTKALLALLFVDDAHFALIDEPTNHLDLASRIQVAQYLKNKRQGFIVISHDRHFLDDVIDHVLVIEKSQLQLFQSDFSTYEAQKAQQDQFELAQNEKMKSEIARLTKTAKEKERWSQARETDKYGKPNVKGSGAINDTGFIGARAARTMKRSKLIGQRAEEHVREKAQLLKNIETIEPLTLNYHPDYHQQLLTVENFTLCFEGVPLFKPLNFTLHTGEIIALMGPNGSGKSSIMAALQGNFSGEIQGEITAVHTKTSAIAQLYPELSSKVTELYPDDAPLTQELLSNLRKLGMERTVFETPICKMSMGQQKKVEVARSLITPASFYLWDEPLNYLDLFNHDQLTRLLLAKKPSMLLVEHDQDFVKKVATKVIEILPN